MNIPIFLKMNNKKLLNFDVLKLKFDQVLLTFEQHFAEYSN